MGSSCYSRDELYFSYNRVEKPKITKKQLLEFIYEDKRYEPQILSPALDKLPESYIYDSSKSDLWNRNRVQELNNEVDALLLMSANNEDEKIALFREDAIIYLKGKMQTELKLDKYPAKFDEIVEYLFTLSLDWMISSNGKNKVLEDSNLEAIINYAELYIADSKDLLIVAMGV